MSKKLKRKSILMITIEIVSLVLLGIFLTAMQTGLSVRSQQRDTQKKIQQIDGLTANADNLAQQTTKGYDDVYVSKAASLAYMAQKKAGIVNGTNAEMKKCADLMNITNALILDREGNVLAQAGRSPVDFTRSRYNQLRTVFINGEPSQPFQVQTGDFGYRYYGAKIDGNRMVVIEHDPEELTQLLDSTTSWESMLDNFSIGLSGYAFAISDKDYSILYHPNADYIGADALDAGIRVEDLEDENYIWMNIYGERLYCGVTKADDAYVICAVPESEIHSSRSITVGIILFIFFAVITIVITYAIFMMMDAEKKTGSSGSDYREYGLLRYNKAVGRKISTLSVVGLMVIFISSFYMQTLFSLSRQAMSNNQHVKEVEATVLKNAEEVDLITRQYNRRYLNKCQVAAYILMEKPELRTRKDLTELRQILDVVDVNVFGADGAITATSAPYTNFKISDDPMEQSFAFHNLLVGNEYLIQEARPDDVSGEYRQYIGVSLRDAKDNADGFVQICVTPSKLQDLLESTGVSSVLGSIRVGVDGFAFAVNKEDRTFDYYPKKKLIGRSAMEYGMEENEFRDGYCDYITVDSSRYYGSSLETDEEYVYVVVPEEELYGSRIDTSLASAGASLICLLLVFLLLTFEYKSKAGKAGTEDKENDGPMIDIVTADGRRQKTMAAATRWSNVSLKWNEKTPEQKISTLLRAILGVLALAICLAVLFKDQFFDEGSIFAYVLDGRWERGVNIFAITGAILIICVISVATMALRELLKMLSKTFSARGETVCRLMSNFLKYVSVIVTMYYCFALFGVDTATLLASAGILSLVIGLGAKTLVSDILAGLFIIFEGEFRVGDIVTIGDWRGTVVEIGVRTTKIMDGGKNIKIISNSSVSGVINMTRQYSVAFCEVGIEYGESLERVENVLEKEFPNIKRRLPAIVDGPFYNGVVSLGDNSVNIRISAQCAEGDRIGLQRSLNREMKLIFDKYDIGIPFPQIVINQPAQFQKATEWEKSRADKFSEEQKELSKSKNMGEREESH